MNLSVAVSTHNPPFRFFDLPREIRDGIYTRTMYFHDDSYIILVPKGKVPNYIGRPRDFRVRLYRRYQEFVSFFTISRQFCDEALPIFWQGNNFEVFGFISLASTPELPDRAHTALDFVGLSGKMCIARISVEILYAVFVKKPGRGQKNSEYDTDLGITIKELLEMMPNLQRLDARLACSIHKNDYPGYEQTTTMLKKAAGSHLDFLSSVNFLEMQDEPKPVITLAGNVSGRPIRAAKEQGTREALKMPSEKVS